jgi:hypothetical protein
MNSTEKGVTFLRRILTGGSHFYVEKLPRGQYSTGVTSLRYIGDKAANLDLCLALTAFSSEGSFTCHTYCDT